MMFNYDRDDDEYDFSHLGGKDFNSLISGFPQHQQTQEQDIEEISEAFQAKVADETATALGKCFRVYNPGGYICKRNREQSGSFVHCSNSVKIIEKYGLLRKAMEERAHLELKKDCMERIHALRNFVSHLEDLVREEQLVLNSINHSEGVDDETSTKIVELSAICDELRIHIGHWNSVKQHLHTNRWLKPFLPVLYVKMEQVRTILNQLRDRAIWWISKFIGIGVEIVANIRKEELSDYALWNIVRGAEEFNAILLVLKESSGQTSCHNVKTHKIGSKCSGHGVVSSGHGVVSFNHQNTLSSSVKPIAFSKMLHTLANVQSKILSRNIHEYFTRHPAIHELIECNKLLKSVDWEELKTKTVTPSKVNEVNGTDSDSSDYYTASISSSSHVCGFPVEGAMQGVPLPSLSKESVPIVELVQSEEEFINRFLKVTCQGTSFLKKIPQKFESKIQPPQQQRPPIHPPQNGLPQKSQSTRPQQEYLPPGGSSSHKVEDSHLGGVISRQDSVRKSVTWGDASAPGIISQLSVRFMNLIWQGLATHLHLMLNQHTFGVSGATHKNYLGHILLCPDSLQMAFLKIMSAKISSGFPASAVTSVEALCQQQTLSLALRQWNRGVCDAMGTSTQDTCGPIPLVEGKYCTKTAKLLHNSLRPLIHVLETCTASSNRHTQEALRHVLPTIVTSCNLVYTWCSSQGFHQLAKKSLSHFLFILHADLKILLEKIVHMATIINNVPKHSDVYSVLYKQSVHIQQISYAVHNLQSLIVMLNEQYSKNCRSTAKDFFEGAMPVGKIWKKKSNQGMPKEANEYAKQAPEAILESVVLGVTQLSQDSQLSAISTAVEALYQVWLDHILAENIHFSVYGASQLSVDFEHVKSTIMEYLDNEALQNGVMALDVFKHAQSVVTLLKRQPQGRPKNRVQPLTNENEAVTVQPQNSTPQQDSKQSVQSNVTPFSCSDCNSEHEPEVGHPSDLDLNIPRMEEWLALRVHGGSRSWLPTCFKKD